ncbi:ComF family protein, partial [Streptococcus agalactiae]|uniref:ComF family protein n=1 Tax=Streptococcus agalactiae TaxID=1311 RepID=UPI000AA0079A
LLHYTKIVQDRNYFLSYTIYGTKNEAELGDNLLIVDDIYTTGATIAQIRKLLEEKGIKNIKSFSLAR